MTSPPEDRLADRPETARIARFDGVERAVHWANAGLVLVLFATAAALYVGPVSTWVGRRNAVKAVHVWAGLLLPVPLLLGVIGSRGRGLRHDLSRLNRWDADDRRWLRSRGRDRRVRLGKFNPGQKLNAAFTAGALTVMLATGVIMRWFEPFPLDWRTGATFVHDWVAIALGVAVAGHIALAMADRDALRAMVRGWVPAAWARRHRPRWYDDVSGPSAARAPAPPPAAR